MKTEAQILETLAAIRAACRSASVVKLALDLRDVREGTAVFDPPLAFVPEWEFSQTDDGRRFAHKPNGGPHLEASAEGIEVGLTAPGDYTDLVPRAVVLWLLGAAGPKI